MAAALTILVTVIYNPHTISTHEDEGDPRFSVVSGLVHELRRRQHRVVVRACDEDSAASSVVKALVDGSVASAFDCAIVWWAAHDLPKVPTVYFENGFSRGDVVADPKGLLADSYYYETLNERLQNSPDTCVARASKRPQDGTMDVTGNYVFVPTQKTRDKSVHKFSALSVWRVVAETAKFASRVGLKTVVKIHPHLEGRERDKQRGWVERLKSQNFRVELSTAPVEILMDEANFTVCLNGGTIVDNARTQTPVLSVAPSLFSKTDTVFYTPDLDRGLKAMLAVDWSQERRKRQRQLICWLANHTFNVEYSAATNLQILQAHFAERYDPPPIF